MPFSNEEILGFATSVVGEEGILHSSEPDGILTLEVKPSQLIDLVGKLKNHPEYQFTFMTDLCGLHLPEQKGKEIGVVYLFHSLTSNTRIRIKTFAPIENPVIPTMVTHFNSANWMERETYDFYGVQFEGHPNLIRILNVDDMDYFPMRKEYPLEDQTRRDKVDEFFGR
jgi:NADH-quinone oxidoreductase subunit C